ncbi:MAG: 23S rRNA (guanosine(2251)-2'-O)-methyltransferase RlmB [Rhodospirillales bacterium]|nr:MAG: 23S rRNA (guanosine(2251)-2'-O)-methyltransferase RlmB [Rhodospirillales bacterium]
MTKRKRSPAASTPRSPHPGAAVWLFGTHAVASAVANPNRTCRRLVATAAAVDTLSALMAAAPVPRPRIDVVEPRELEALLPPGAVHQGLAAQAVPLSQPDLESLLHRLGPDAPCRLVVLDQASDPRNIGAVLRSAAAFGAAATIAQDRHAPAETGTLAKAASGALEVVPMVAVTNVARALDRLKLSGFWCLGLAAEADRPLSDLEPLPRVALVIGAEGPGLRRLVRDRCDVLVHIPIRTGPSGLGVDSLNLSVAAAVALYELARHDPSEGRRSAHGPGK